MDVSQDFLIQMTFSQKLNKKFIDSFCINCLHHSIMLTNHEDIHICNDVWSGLHEGNGVGEHIFYSETKDICIECDGFKALAEE
jgi:hypothetical protein